MAIKSKRPMDTANTPHSQEVFFDNNTVRGIDDVVSIERGQWFHLRTKSGVEFITNPDRILFIRIKPKK